MKRKLLLASAFILIGLCAVSFYIRQNKKHIVLFSDATESISGDGDADARYKWELMRLADPETGKIPEHIRAKELEFAATLPRVQTPPDADIRSVSIANFTSRGPWNVGGRTRGIAVDVTNENIIFAGSVNGGLWRSTDAGATWARVSPMNQNPSVTWIAQDKRPGHTSTWYYSSGEGYGASASATGAYYLGNGIYKSINGGLTWNVLTSTSSGTPQTFENVWDIAWKVVCDVHDTVNNVVYASTYGAIFRSINGGTSWSVDRGSNASAPFSYFTDVDVTSTGIVYASLSSDGSQKGIWRKSGAAWANITPVQWASAFYDRQVIGINPSNENEIYFLGVTDSTIGKATTNYKGDREWNGLWKYTYISGDGTGSGGAWTNLSQNIPYDSSQLGNFNAQGGYDLVVKVHPDHSNIVYIGGTNLFRSTDGFTSTVNTTTIGGYAPGSTLPFYTNYLNHHSDQHNLVFLPSNHDVMLSSSDGGVMRTLDNRASTVVWQSLNDGYVTSQFYTVAIDHGATPNDIVIGGLQDNGTWFTNTTTNTSPWNMPGQGDGSFCAIADGHTSYYMSRQEGRVAKATLDASGNVTSFRRIDPIGGSNYLFISPFVLDPSNSNIMYLASGNGIWRNDSLDQIALTGQWDSISQGWFRMTDTIAVAGTLVTALAVSKTPANRLYYGTNNKKVYRVDNSNTMSPDTINITSTLFPAGYVNCIAVDPNDGNKVMVVFSNYGIYSLFYTSDGGITWVKTAGNLEQNAAGTGNGPSLRWASIIPVSNGTVYLVGTSVGLFGTNTLNGTSTVWTQLASSAIGNMVVDMLDYRTNDGLVVAGTHGAGVFSANITDTITSGFAETFPVAFNMVTFPNPSSEKIAIRFSLSSSENVTLKIYDVRGVLVTTIAEGKLNAGEHQYLFEKKNHPEGVYFARLMIGNTTIYSSKFVMD